MRRFIKAEIRGIDETLPQAEDLLAEEPLEDGQPHQADRIVEYLAKHHGGDFGKVLQARLQGQIDPDVLAGLIRCLGRVTPSFVFPWGLTATRAALRHSNVRIRGAAVRALEAWGTHGALSVLGQHEEPVRWLAEHINEILASPRTECESDGDAEIM
jgi:hypothetical protein